MALWFVAIGVLGLFEIVQHPFVLLAISPSYAVGLCIQYKGLAFIVLGAVVLCVTGAEALYADMGHFGAHPIRLTWTYFVLPCLVLNYFGQGALTISDPTAVSQPVLPAGAGLAAPADGDPGHGGDDHRQPGGDLRRLFDDAAMHAAGLPAAHDRAPHLEHRGRPDLRAAGQHHAGDRRADPGAGVQDLGQPRRRLRHRGDRHVPVHLRAGDGGVPPAVPLVARGGDLGVRPVLPDRSACSSPPTR